MHRTPEAGTSLPLLDEPGPGPHWAAGTPVGPAYAALRTAARSSAGLLDADDRALLHTTLWEWNGAHPSAVLRGFPSRHERPGARLAPPAALAPYRITDEDVAAWRRPEHTDHCLVHLVAYGAFTAVERIESALAETGSTRRG